MAWIAAIISAVAGGASGAGQKNAANKATKQAAAERRQYYNEAVGRAAPYSAAGRASLSSLSELMGLEGYRTKEERAYQDYISNKPSFDVDESQYKPGGMKGFFLRNERMSTVGDSLGGVTKGIKKEKKKIARQVANERAARQAAWQAEADRLKELSDASLQNYDREATTRGVLEATPGYQFRYGQGLRAVQANQAARSGTLSGRALKELTQYGQGFGSNEYQNEWARRFSLAGMGQSADTTLANMAVGQGSALANLAVQQGQANADYYGTLNNAAQSGIKNYLTYQERQNNRGTEAGINPYSSGFRNDYPAGNADVTDTYNWAE